MNSVTSIPINKLHPFKGHPYKVVDNTEMNNLAESIQENGILTPLLIRPLEGTIDEYEVISGHRRLYAAQKAGMGEVPAFIYPIDRAAAAILLVDSNLHREHILPSEKAFAYKLKFDAMKHQGRTSGQVGQKLTVDDISEDDSGRQVKRYIRLTNLIPEPLDLMDEGRIAFSVGVELSYLDQESRTDIYTKNRGLEALLCTVFSHMVYRAEWKGRKCRVKQLPVLDYAQGRRWYIDFSRLTIKIKRKKKLFHPVDFVNSAVLVLHAEKERRDEALPHLGDSFHVLLNCAKSNAPGVIPVSDKDLKAVDTDALSRFTHNSTSVAVLLRHWTEPQCEEWASEMIARAKQAIGNPDSRFVNVSYDPVILRKAVRREVLMDFLARNEAIGLLSHEEHAAFVEKVETAGTAPVLRKAEDPEVVLSVVRRFILENSEKIAQPDEDITPKSGHVAAWRTINHDDVLVFDEKAFFPWYRSQIKVDDTIDASIFKDDKFDLIILRNLVADGKIKPHGDNPRYAYNLYAKGKANRINVVCFYSRELLLPSEEVTAGD